MLCPLAVSSLQRVASSQCSFIVVFSVGDLVTSCKESNTLKLEHFTWASWCTTICASWRGMVIFRRHIYTLGPKIRSSYSKLRKVSFMLRWQRPERFSNRINHQKLVVIYEGWNVYEMVGKTWYAGRLYSLCSAAASWVTEIASCVWRLWSV